MKGGTLKNLVGTLFGGRFLIDLEIGRGQYAIVYLARDLEKRDQQVALKVLQSQTDPLLHHLVRQRFKQEADVHRGIMDPRIPRFHEFVVHQERTLAIAMEYICGRELRHDSCQIVSPAIWARRFLQMAQIVDSLHLQKVYHRDLCPDNFLLRGTGDLEQITLVDLGLAWSDSERASCPEPRGRIGFASIEQLYAEQRWPCASDDLFTLGVTFYVLLTNGVHPYGNEGWTLTEPDWGHRPFNPLREINPSLPTSLAAIVERLGALPTSLRYHSAEELVYDLERVGQTRL